MLLLEQSEGVGDDERHMESPTLQEGLGPLSSTKTDRKTVLASPQALGTQCFCHIFFCLHNESQLRGRGKLCSESLSNNHRISNDRTQMARHEHLMSTCARVRPCVGLCTAMHVCEFVCMCVHVCTHLCMRVCLVGGVQTCVCVHVSMCACMHVCPACALTCVNACTPAAQKERLA
jgi:hypothetical protein